MPTEPKEGYTEFKHLIRPDFEKLSRWRQVLELQRTGMLVDNGDEAVKFYIKTDKKLYPSTHVDTKVPDITPRTLPTTELIFYHKIRRLYQRLRELRREARHCMSRKLIEGRSATNGKYI